MKDIPGFEERYAATEDGRIYSYPKYKFKGRFLKPSLSQKYKGKGYYSVPLRKDGKTLILRVHKLIALTFIINDNPERTQVNHKDENKLNNAVENLEWCTQQENLRWYWSTHSRPIDKTWGDKKSARIIKVTARKKVGKQGKLSEVQVKNILEEYKINRKATYRTLGEKYEVSHTTIYFIVKGIMYPEVERA